MNISILVLTQASIYAALFTLLLQHTHFLIALLSLEGIMLATVLFVPISINDCGISIQFIRIVILTIGACEARLGLSLIVNISRSHGSDLISTLSLRKC